MDWDLRPKLVCRKCGNDDSKLFGLIYNPDHDNAPRMPLSSPYLKAKNGG